MDYLLDILEVDQWYQKHYYKGIKGLRVTFNHIEPFIRSLKKCIDKNIEGYSEDGIPICSITYGKGSTRILVWSQMHGNEGTGTKALLDLFTLLEGSKGLENVIETLVNNCSITFVPILNPDGANLFTRVNKNNIDLNRDAVTLIAKESKILRKVLETKKPHYCFNLHDQRTIFNVSGTVNPATLSFLAPSEEESRKVTQGRKETMGVIATMYELLRQVIPNSIGRYTDEFYPTATGDNFQKMGYPTVLIEAGYYPNDDQREKVRKFNFMALLQGVYAIASGVNFKTCCNTYSEIPENGQLFYDLIVRSVLQEGGHVVDIAYQYDYRINEGTLKRFFKEVQRGDLNHKRGHFEI